MCIRDRGRAGRVHGISVAPNFLPNDAVSDVPLLRRLLWGAVVQVVLTQLGPTSCPQALPSLVWHGQEEQPSPHPSSSLPASVYLPRKAGPKAPPACLPPPRPQRPAETKTNLLPPRRPVNTKAPEEIPPELVQEYMEIMEELLEPPAGATGELEAQWEEPGLLSYIEKLCSQEDFLSKVGWPEVLGSAGFRGG
nr:NUT family member 2G-like [Aotus nancymaae]